MTTRKNQTKRKPSAKTKAKSITVGKAVKAEVVDPVVAEVDDNVESITSEVAVEDNQDAELIVEGTGIESVEIDKKESVEPTASEVIAGELDESKVIGTIEDADDSVEDNQDAEEDVVDADPTFEDPEDHEKDDETDPFPDMPVIPVLDRSKRYSTTSGREGRFLLQNGNRFSVKGKYIGK